MASDADVALFKTHLSGVDGIWTDDRIGPAIDSLGSVSKAVQAFWSAKVNETYRYMDVSESSSSRSMSVIYRNAFEQLSRWDKIVSDEAARAKAATGSIRFGRITR